MGWRSHIIGSEPWGPWSGSEGCRQGRVRSGREARTSLGDGLRAWEEEGAGAGQARPERFCVGGSEPDKKTDFEFFGAGRGEAWSGATEARDGLDFGLGRSRG